MSLLITKLKKHTKKTGFETQSFVTDVCEDLSKDKKAFNLDEINSIMSLLLRNRSFQQASLFLKKLDKENVRYNKAQFINFLYQSGHSDIINTIDSFEELTFKSMGILANLSVNNEKLSRIIQNYKLKAHEKQTKLKESLLEKFEFFRTQHLEEKSKEILAELIESFPKEKSLQKYTRINQEKKYEKVIAETAKRSLKTKNQDENSIFNKEDLKIRQNWFKLWKEEFSKNGTLLHEQMTFLDSKEDPQITAELLDIPELNIWDKIDMLHKTKRFYEGLAILDGLEAEVLANQSKMMYNFYYYKALMLKGAGLEKEALSILEAIIEQNASFRDVKYLHKKWQ